MNKTDLEPLVRDAVIALGGRATVLMVAKCLCANHEGQLRAAGDLFYTWQYDMRWAAQRLTDTNRLRLDGRYWVSN